MVNAEFSVDEGVAHVEIQRPEALNALDSPTKRAIIDRMREFRDDDAVRVVLLSGEGKAFCAGGDLKEIPDTDYSLSAFTETWEELFDVMTGMGKPTVAKVGGYALGGGFDLLCHTDIAIAAHDAKIGQPEIGLGIVNHFAPPVLRESVGVKQTFDLLMTGRMVSGEEAERMGLVARSVPAEDLDDEVDALVDSLKTKSPRIMAKLKAGLYETLDKGPTATRDHLESVALESARVDPDYREGVDAKLQDRPPEWSERR